MKKNIGLLILSVVFLAACNKPDQKKVERLIKEQVLVKTNQNATQVILTEENADQFLAKVTLENGQVMELIFKGDLEKYELAETLNSETMRQIAQMLGVNCTDMSLVAQDSVNYEGGAKLQTGETLKLHVEPKKGWYPIDQESLAVLIKYQLQKYALMPCKNVSLEKQPEGDFIGVGTFEDGKTLQIRADYQKGWFVANHLPSLITAVGFEIKAQKVSFDTIFAEPSKDNTYEGKIITENGKKQIRLVIGHTGQGFNWKVEDENAQTKK